jgi:S-adenosylmethionine:tRNA ribosyltransferase-isomerase
MLVSGRQLEHASFRDLGDHLSPGDLLVVNTSATVAAAVEGSRQSGQPVTVHFASALDDGTHVVELRRTDGSGPQLDAEPGERITLAAGALLRLVEPRNPVGPRRLWRAIAYVPGSVADWLERHGHAIAYGQGTGRLPLAMYQTVFAREPGSAEMPSAGRPFTTDMVVDLLARGIGVAPLVLHASVSSLEAGEPPLPERYHVPEATARLVNVAHQEGHRVVAVGTTVARALETVARPDGSAGAGQGWTDLVLSPERPARLVDALLTGWHEPESSHLLLLQAVAGNDLVRSAYAAAVAHRYRWHEFGDSCLFLAGRHS